MKRERVLEEIDRRIKRLRAEVEIAETSLERVKGRRYPKIKDYSTVYVILMFAWLITGLLLLMALSKKVPTGIPVPTRLYALILMAFSIPLLYIFITKNRKSELGEELAERARMAKLLIREFYGPLRKAVENGDRGALEALAERLLNDSRLAGAMEVLNEGDPKLVAYSLLLYSKFSPELRGEVEDTTENLTNKPVKALLQSLLEPKDYNGEGHPIGGRRT